MDKIVDILQKSIVFEGKANTEIKEILSQLEYKICTFSKNEYIFRTDQPGTHVGIIIKGSIEVQKIFPSGKIISVVYRKKGEIFGGSPAFLNQPHQSDIIAKENSEILLIHKDVFLNLLYQNNTFHKMLSLAANNVAQLNKKIELLSYSSIKQKIAYFLLNSCDDTTHDVIDLPYSKKSWAENLNVSRPSLCRELKNLCDEKILEVNDKRIKILQKEKLYSLLTN